MDDTRPDEVKIEGLSHLISCAAREYAELYVARPAGAGVRISVHPSAAAMIASCGARAPRDGNGAFFLAELSKPQAFPRFGGMDVFSCAEARGSSLLLFIEPRLLEHFALIAPMQEDALPERIEIPARGTAADGGASAYVRARLKAYRKSGSGFAQNEAALGALFHCLRLFSTPREEMPRAHASAVRLTLAALDAAPLGGVNSAAMSAALAFAERVSNEK